MFKPKINYFKDKLYNEVSILQAGSSFGELALISSKPRAATIRTKTNCFFAVLEKEDYNKIYGAIQEKILNEKIDFFKSLPIFSGWTRASVAKLTYFFTEKEFKRNHFVYKEGDIRNCCFVVNEGEFESTKEVIIGKPKKGEDEMLKDFVKSSSKNSITRFHKEKLQHLKLSNNLYFLLELENGLKKENSKEIDEKIINDYQTYNYKSSKKFRQNQFESICFMHDKNKTNDIQFISKFQKGSLIADEDLYFSRENYSTTLKCTSESGKLFIISCEDLSNQLQSKQNSHEIFSRNAINKEIKMLRKLLTKEDFLK